MLCLILQTHKFLYRIQPCLYSTEDPRKWREYKLWFKIFMKKLNGIQMSKMTPVSQSLHCQPIGRNYVATQRFTKGTNVQQFSRTHLRSVFQTQQQRQYHSRLPERIVHTTVLHTGWLWILDQVLCLGRLPSFAPTTLVVLVWPFPLCHPHCTQLHTATSYPVRTDGPTDG